VVGLTVEYDVAVPVRDGVFLRADVYRPDGLGPWPVSVARIPYSEYVDFFRHHDIPPTARITSSRRAVADRL